MSELRKITLKEYNAKHSDFRGVWTTERPDWPDWGSVREKYVGKRTMLDYDPASGGTVLLVEGLSFEII
jgi:hypothetical protein